MDFAAVTQMIGSLGFPIAACSYMMFTVNKTMQANTDATNNLAHLVQTLMEKVGSGRDDN